MEGYTPHELDAVGSPTILECPLLGFGRGQRSLFHRWGSIGSDCDIGAMQSLIVFAMGGLGCQGHGISTIS